MPGEVEEGFSMDRFVGWSAGLNFEEWNLVLG
jgi:hypothetical protein